MDILTYVEEPYTGQHYAKGYIDREERSRLESLRRALPVGSGGWHFVSLLLNSGAYVYGEGWLNYQPYPYVRQMVDAILGVHLEAVDAPD